MCIPGRTTCSPSCLRTFLSCIYQSHNTLRNLVFYRQHSSTFCWHTCYSSFVSHFVVLAGHRPAPYYLRGQLRPTSSTAARRLLLDVRKMKFDHDPLPTDNSHALKIVQALARVVARRRLSRDYGQRPGEGSLPDVMYEMPDKNQKPRFSSTKRQTVL